MLIYVLLILPVAVTRGAPMQQPPIHPTVNERVPHTAREIPEEEIIQLPIGRFPEPVCDYSMHARDRSGPVVTG